MFTCFFAIISFLWQGIFIKEVVPDSPVGKDGRIMPGDRILQVMHWSIKRCSSLSWPAK